MKTCGKCGFENYGEGSSCGQCGASLLHIRAVSGESKAEAFFLRQEKKEKRRKIIKLLLIPLYYLIYLPFFVLCVRHDSESLATLLIPLVFPLLYYLLSFKAEWLFRIEHMHHIDNIDQVEISDYYYISSQIGAYLLLAAGLILVIWLYFSMTDTSGIVVEADRVLPR